jgi:hypothetical protein
LLTLDRPGEAAAHFERALERNTGRTFSLLGLARAQEAVGDPAAEKTWMELRKTWKGGFSALIETEYVWL